MDNNYTKIIEAFLSGSIDDLDEYGLKPEHLETQISHVLLYPKTVYKICKRDNVFFNEHFRDLSDRDSRIQFYKSDFFENNYFSPDVYLGIFGISLANNKVIVSSDIDSAEDVIMKMRRIDLSYNLSHLLHNKSLSKDDLESMGYQQTKEVALYPHQPKSTESHYLLFNKRLDDLRDWMYSAPNYFSREKTDWIIEKLRNYLFRNKSRFENFDTSKYVISLDNHSDNIFYENKKLFFLDIYPPKEDWMIVSPEINIYRPATDILLLMGEEYARSFISGYKKYYGFLDESDELFYFVYSAAIQGVSLFNLSHLSELKKKDAELYKVYILENIEKI